MKVLITGGAGFIGSQIAETLCRQGAVVRVLDNLSSGKVENLAWRQPGDDLELAQGDVRDARLVRELATGCDLIFHEAALPSVPYSVAQPVETNEVNLEGTLNCLVAARDAKVKRLVFASTSAIYGGSEAPSKHEGLLLDPLSPYALQKYASEKYASIFQQYHGVETVCLRYFNVFGPRQAFDSPYSGVIAKFCTTMLAGCAPTIFGDGLQSRDFIYVANVVAANLLAATAPAERVNGKVFNVGGGDSINLLQLAAELNRLLGARLQPQFAPARAGDVRSSQADITAARRDLGYEPTVSWQAGLARTLDFYRV